VILLAINGKGRTVEIAPIGSGDFRERVETLLGITP
jgi:hypothetical protein